jgi:hypothetical protein
VEIFIKDLGKYGLDEKHFKKQIGEYATYPLGVLANQKYQNGV